MDAAQPVVPATVAYPSTEAELRRAVRIAGERGLPVRVIGQHAAVAARLTAGVALHLRRYKRILRIDRQAQLATIQAGAPLWLINEGLNLRNLALPTHVEDSHRTLGGALSTGAHGSGIGTGGLASHVVALELVRPDGSILACSADDEPDLVGAAAVALGLLGVISTVTLRCAAATNVRAVEEVVSLDAVIGNLEAWAGAAQHLDLRWGPTSEWVVVRRAETATSGNEGRSLLTDLAERYEARARVMSQLDNLTRSRPAAGRGLYKRVAPHLARRYVDRSGWVLSRRIHGVPSVEYAVAVGRAGGVLAALSHLARQHPDVFDAPCRVRFSGSDQILLSPAYGRATAHIAVGSWALAREDLDELVQPIMDAADGRPHWGRVYHRGPATLAPLYPGWDRWQELRRRLDPAGAFASPYTDRAFGPVQGPR